MNGGSGIRKLEDDLLGRVEALGVSLARRQIVNEHLGPGTCGVSAEGRRILEVFDRLVSGKGWR